MDENKTVSVEFVYAGETVAVEIGATGAATFCSDKPLDFTEVDGVKAYIVSAFRPSTGMATLTRVMDVPAGTGLVLIGDAGSYNIPVGLGETYVVNILVGITADKTLNETDGDYSNFILSDGEKGLGFYAVNSGTTLAAGKAYLSLPTAVLPNNAQSIGLRFDDDATGIDTESFEPEWNNQEWFDMSGRRLEGEPSEKGLYILNGKKVIVK